MEHFTDQVEGIGLLEDVTEQSERLWQTVDEGMRTRQPCIGYLDR